MASKWRVETFENAPLQIIDGDRGLNYPNQSEFAASGHCLFLNAGNVTTSGFRFSDCAFITAEKDALLRKGKLVRNDVVLTTRGTVGNAAYFDDSVPFDHIRINSGMVILRAQTPALQPRFLYLFVRSALFHAQVSALRTGSAQPQLPIQDINRIEIPIPSPDEQRAIAYILGTLDDKIELNRRMNETLEAMARALFKSWFVDFDPVRAKAEGRDPGLPNQIAKLFPDSFEDSELGEIPKGWRSTCWGDLVTLEYGKSLSGYNNEVGAYPVYGTNGRIGLHSVPLCKHPGIIIGRKGAYRGIHFCDKPFFVIDTAFYVEPKRPVELRWAYYELLRNDINSMDSGSAIPSTSREDFYSLPVLFPSYDIQQVYVQLCTPFWVRQRYMNEESRMIGTLRETLLPKLLSGEIQVPIRSTDYED